MPEMLSVSIKPDTALLARAFAAGTVHKFLQQQVKRLAFSVERYAKQLTPVDSGRLRASIHTSPGTLGLSAVVSTRTNYAFFVHEGTKYMRGRPFMKYGAMFAQVAEMKDINVRLDREFTQAFKNAGFRQY
jgi:HK97 gp10 family phage protein